MGLNVLLVVLDAARASNLSLYGHGAETSPFLDTFADDATTYTQARAPSNWSLPSHASMFTGLDVHEHNLQSRYDRLAPGHTVWEALRDDHGYETGVFSRNPFITTDIYGLSAGFDTIETGLSTRRYPFARALDPETVTARDSSLYGSFLRTAIDHDRPIRSLVNGLVRETEKRVPSLLPSSLSPETLPEGEIYVDCFLEWVANRDRWAACINLVDTHHPYLPVNEHELWGGQRAKAIHDSLADHRWEFYSGRRPWWECRALESLYDGCIRQADAAVERLVSGLESRALLNDTLLIITSDHGEGFGERSRVRPEFRIADHVGGVHEHLLHVPLLVRTPDDKVGNTADRPVSLTDLALLIESVAEGAEGDTGNNNEIGGQATLETDGPVVSSVDLDRQFEYPPNSYEAYAHAIPDGTFKGRATITYRETEDRIRKDVLWGNDTAAIEVMDAQNAMRIGPGDRTFVRNVRRSFEDADVRRPNERVDDVNDAAYERLKDLGYV